MMDNDYGEKEEETTNDDVEHGLTTVGKAVEDEDVDFDATEVDRRLLGPVGIVERVARQTWKQSTTVEQDVIVTRHKDSWDCVDSEIDFLDWVDHPEDRDDWERVEIETAAGAVVQRYHPVDSTEWEQHTVDDVSLNREQWTDKSREALEEFRAMANGRTSEQRQRMEGPNMRSVRSILNFLEEQFRYEKPWKSGTVDCRNCDGTGRVYDPEFDRPYEAPIRYCPNGNGRRVLDCDCCSSTGLAEADMDCPDCEGDGKVSKEWYTRTYQPLATEDEVEAVSEREIQALQGGLNAYFQNNDGELKRGLWPIGLVLGLLKGENKRVEEWIMAQYEQNLDESDIEGKQREVRANLMNISLAEYERLEDAGAV